MEHSAQRAAGSLVRLAGSGLIVPPSCACCGEPAARSEPLRSPGKGYELFIGYCEDCSGHVGAERARKLAGGIGSMLLGLGLAFALPLSPRPMPPVALAALTLLGALLPIGIVALWPRRPGRGHAAEGPAVRAVSEDQVLAANEHWSRDFARANDLKREHATFRESRISLGMLPGPVLAPLLAVLAYGTTSPVMRVLNLSGERIHIEVDGTRVADVDPTSVESPAAGVELRISVGRHELVARGPTGELIERTPVTIQSGRAHLFAPGSTGYCFWLETSGYGRSPTPAVTREPLGGAERFWSLPENLGGWFLPAPAAALAEARLTGGVVTVLRQSPCDP